MIGTGELVIIFCVILVLFGGKKLPELARNLGFGIREFKKAYHGLDDELIEKTMTKTPPKTVEIETESELNE
jgi:sec-independent protein translocase protein TatA